MCFSKSGPAPTSFNTPHFSDQLCTENSISSGIAICVGLSSIKRSKLHTNGLGWLAPDLMSVATHHFKSRFHVI
jgi:hypothetical protein